MSLGAGFHYHEVLTDIGLVQTTSMEENLPETIRQLEGLLPYRPALVRALAQQVREAACEMVLCDVAPLGIAVAREAGLPSVLEENFTWDWIYEGYLDQRAALRAVYCIPTRSICIRRYPYPDGTGVRVQPGCRPADQRGLPQTAHFPQALPASGWACRRTRRW